MRKKELRSLYKSRRDAISREELEIGSSKISKLFFDGIYREQYKTVHCFLPAVQKKEINTWHIINGLKDRFPQVEVTVPVCDIKTNSFHSCHFDPTISLKENEWGIPEPQEMNLVDSQKIDLVVLPLLVFDMKGNRVGYGKGFYDRFLSTCNPGVVKVGLSLFEAVPEISDANLYDVPMDFAITPDKIYKFRKM